uniref:Putative secreted protein n=1 Tax=Anopheles darlingi TaxID=43151 RepID=A0A2M4D7R0_ANODA
MVASMSGKQRNMLPVLLLLVLCVGLPLEGVRGSAIPSASFPPNSASSGIANSASSSSTVGLADGGSTIRRPLLGATVAGSSSCLAVHPILQRRGVEQIDMPIDPIPGE